MRRWLKLYEIKIDICLDIDFWVGVFVDILGLVCGVYIGYVILFYFILGNFNEYVVICVCVCVWLRERERKRERGDVYFYFFIIGIMYVYFVFLFSSFFFNIFIEIFKYVWLYDVIF